MATNPAPTSIAAKPPEENNDDGDEELDQLLGLDKSDSGVEGNKCVDVTEDGEFTPTTSQITQLTKTCQMTD